jgi:hypothetical protein
MKRDDLEKRAPGDLEPQSLPPVVARLVVEIRSDGSRTVARGALEDVAAGEHVAVEAEGQSPLQLAIALARSLVKVPFLGRVLARGLLPKKREK